MTKTIGPIQELKKVNRPPKYILVSIAPSQDWFSAFFCSLRASAPTPEPAQTKTKEQTR